MKRILMIAPQSFPVTGAEAIVNIKLLKALSNSNKFAIDLVSKKDKWSNYESDTLESLGVNLRSINVIEVDNKVTLTTIWLHFLSIFFFAVAFKGSHWAVKAIPCVRKLIKYNNYDYVLTKNAPSLLLGDYVKCKFGIKWVATWNDPYPTNFYPHPYGKGVSFRGTIIDKLLVKKMQKSVDLHIFPNARIENYMRNYLQIDESKCSIIPHVVLNMKDSEVINKSVVNNETLKIIHSGNLLAPRNPISFLNAFSRFVKQYPNAKIELSILGVFENQIKEYIENSGIKSYINTLKSVTYSQSLEELKNHHIALIIEADCEEGIFLPTKVSDFMQCGKPIFSVSPRKGVLNDLFRNHNINYFASINDEDEIYNEISRMYADFIESEGIKPCNIPVSYEEDQVVSKYLNI